MCLLDNDSLSLTEAGDAHSDPYATVGLGAQYSLGGGLMLVRPGQYTETPLLQRQLLIKAAGGNAVIGY